MNGSTFRTLKEKMVKYYCELKKKKFKLNLRKKSTIMFLCTLLLLTFIVSGAFAVHHFQQKQETVAFGSKPNAYKVTFGNQEIGTVQDTESVILAFDKIQNELLKKVNLDVVINENISFEDVYVENGQITPLGVIRDNITKNLSFDVYAYAININGKQFGVLESEALAEKLLKSIKEPYINRMKEENSNLEEIGILEEVEIVRKKVPASEVQDFNTVLTLFEKGTTEEKVHIVQKGENYWNIAKKYNLTVDELIQANPGKNHILIHPGDGINLIVPKPYLTVVTWEEKTFSEKIKYDKKTEYTSSLYKDQVQVKRKGVYGEKQVTAKVKKINGIEVAKEILNEVIISNPIAQINLQGTKKLPSLKGTGIFMRPTRGSLTSRFGMRWGRMHNGVDLASRTGTPIKAADGGVVTYAGWKGNYGYLVEIDHGGGFKTRYGHCSKIYVKVGQKVYKDKTIAAVGSTGRSTGPHVHFEVLKHGVPQDPFKYIGKKYR